MDYFPIFLDLKNKPCTVVGGGEVAFRKITLLRKAGVEVDKLGDSTGIVDI